MGNQRKPVIVRKFSRDWTAGYADGSPGPWSDAIELLDTGGKVVRIGWEQVKWVCYVRDLNPADALNPERLLHKRFTVRPRAAGLWLRMTLNDGDEIEGLAANDKSLVDGAGLMLTPPDTRSNTQRIFVPRQAIQSLDVVSLIGAGTRKRRSQGDEMELFPADE